MNENRSTIIIATYERPEPLRRALDSLCAQTLPPKRVVVVDASRDELSREAVGLFSSRLPVEYHRADSPSSAVQRNFGMEFCSTPLVVFMDDDAVLSPSVLEQLTAVFDRDAGEKVGGVSARMEGCSHPRPRGALWWYYRWQAGYDHPTYGGKLFGPAINAVPCYEAEEEELIPADWLPSTCVMFRSSLVRQWWFPHFRGYSFMEDVHLSARIARTHTLYFHRNAWFRHENAPSTFKVSKRQLARDRLANQRCVAEEVLGQSGPVFELKFMAHRIFATLSVMRRREKDWKEELAGLWL